MSTNANPPPGPAPRKRTPLWIWVLVALLGLFLLAGIAVTAGAYLLYHKAKEVAVTAEKNPALAAARLLAAVNPDLEVVSTDEGRGLITIRDRKTGKTVTVNLEDIRQGRISFEQEGEEAVTLQAEGEGQSGRLRVRSKEGVVELGTDVAANLPAWFPAYPGAALSGTYQARTGGEQSLGFQFQTQDSVARVLEFYEQALKAAGLEVSTYASRGASGNAGVLSAKDSAEHRTALVQVNSEGRATRATVTLVTRK